MTKLTHLIKKITKLSTYFCTIRFFDHPYNVRVRFPDLSMYSPLSLGVRFLLLPLTVVERKQRFGVVYIWTRYIRYTVNDIHIYIYDIYGYGCNCSNPSRLGYISAEFQNILGQCRWDIPKYKLYSLSLFFKVSPWSDQCACVVTN